MRLAGLVVLAALAGTIAPVSAASLCPVGTQNVRIALKGGDPKAPAFVMPYEGGDFSTSDAIRWDFSDQKTGATFVAACYPNAVNRMGAVMVDIPAGVAECAFRKGSLNCYAPVK